MQDKIAQLQEQNLPIDEAFRHLIAQNSDDNNQIKELLKELIVSYTAKLRADLKKRSEELEQAQFAFNKAENELTDKLRTCFNSLLNAGVNDICKDYLEELALSDLSGLQILYQTSQSAFINILEASTLINERTNAVSNYLLINSCSQISKARILQAAKLILQAALELGNLWQSYAQELIYGCIGGLYEALELICERAIKEFKLGCDKEQAKQLLNLEDDLRSLIASLTGNDFAGSILRDIYDNQLSSLSARFSRALGRGRHILDIKLSELISEETKKSAQMLQLDARAAAAKLINKLRK